MVKRLDHIVPQLQFHGLALQTIDELLILPIRIAIKSVSLPLLAPLISNSPFLRAIGGYFLEDLLAVGVVGRGIPFMFGLYLLFEMAETNAGLLVIHE